MKVGLPTFMPTANESMMARAYGHENGVVGRFHTKNVAWHYRSHHKTAPFKSGDHCTHWELVTFRVIPAAGDRS
jgi:hypothetical protein